FSTRTLGMTLLGGVGGGLGYYGAMFTEFGLNPNVPWADVKEQMGPLLLRAGGAEDLRQAILQGAVGGTWERFIGEHGSFGDARQSASDFGLLVNGLTTP